MGGTMDKKAKNPMKWPFLISLLCAVLLVAAFFLPLSSAKGDYREKQKEMSDYPVTEGSSMTYGDLMDISMYECGEVFTILISEGGYTGTMAIGYIALIVAIGLFSLLSLLFVFLKHPVPVLVFNALNLLLYLCWTFSELVESSLLDYNRSDWGVAYYLYYICFLGLFAGAVWLLVVKRRNKRSK